MTQLSVIEALLIIILKGSKDSVLQDLETMDCMSRDFYGNDVFLLEYNEFFRTYMTAKPIHR